MNTESFRVFTKGGDKLSGHIWSPSDRAPVAVMLLLHGYGEHHMRYVPMAQQLLTGQLSPPSIGTIQAENSVPPVAIVSFDFRGHGISDGPRGYVEDYDHYLDDVDAILTYMLGKDCPISTTVKSVPLLLFGHSNGGLIASLWVSRRMERSKIQPVSVFLSSPFFGLAAPPPGIHILASLAHCFAPKSYISGVDPTKLSEDVEQCELYAADPAVLKGATSGFVRAALRAHDETLEECKRPVWGALSLCLLMGTLDAIVSPDAVGRWYSACAAKAKSWHELDGMHELFNEETVKRSKAYRTLREWIASSVSK